eukprot:2129716-Pyramimonas_sp.AAC.1
MGPVGAPRLCYHANMLTTFNRSRLPWCHGCRSPLASRVTIASRLSVLRAEHAGGLPPWAVGVATPEPERQHAPLLGAHPGALLAVHGDQKLSQRRGAGRRGGGAGRRHPQPGDAKHLRVQPAGGARHPAG